MIWRMVGSPFLRPVGLALQLGPRFTSSSLVAIILTIHLTIHLTISPMNLLDGPALLTRCISSPFHPTPPHLTSPHLTSPHLADTLTLTLTLTLIPLPPPSTIHPGTKRISPATWTAKWTSSVATTRRFPAAEWVNPVLYLSPPPWTTPTRTCGAPLPPTGPEAIE